MVRIELGDWIHRSGLRKSYVSAVSGVSRSSINRIEKGETDPNLGTLRELAIACGFDMDVSVRPLSDHFAAQAARQILEEGFVSEATEAVAEWAARIGRVGHTDPLSIVEYAGRALGLRELGARGTYLRGNASVLRLASAADAANAPWAISGRAHFQLATDDEVEGPNIVWTENPRLVAELLSDTLTTSRSPETASVIVAPAPSALLQHSFTHQGVTYVAPIQAIIDGFSLGGKSAVMAKTIAESW